MKTHDRIDTGVREYIPTRQNKTAAEIQREINLMRLALAVLIGNQNHRDRMVGWCLIAIGLSLPAITALLLLLD